VQVAANEASKAGFSFAANAAAAAYATDAELVGALQDVVAAATEAAAAQASPDSVAAIKDGVRRQCADIVRKHFPEPPISVMP
jgi:hypothetical protein